MPDLAMRDQAEGLRRLMCRKGLRVLPVAGGANAAERSLAIAQLAAALGAAGCATVVLDQSKGAVARALGASPRYELLHLIEGEKSFGEIAVSGSDGVRLVSASRGLARLAQTGGQGERLFGTFARLESPADLVLLNVESPEIAARVLPAGEGEVLLIASTAPESVTGAYAHIKQLVRTRGLARFRVLLADSADAANGRRVLDNIAAVARRFLGAQIAPAAIVPRDPRWRSAAGRDGALVLRAPEAPAARVLRRLASDIEAWRLIELPARSQ